MEPIPSGDECFIRTWLTLCLQFLHPVEFLPEQDGDACPHAAVLTDAVSQRLLLGTGEQVPAHMAHGASLFCGLQIIIINNKRRYIYTITTQQPSHVSGTRLRWYCSPPVCQSSDFQLPTCYYDIQFGIRDAFRPGWRVWGEEEGVAVKWNLKAIHFNVLHMTMYPVRVCSNLQSVLVFGWFRRTFRWLYVRVSMAWNNFRNNGPPQTMRTVWFRYDFLIDSFLLWYEYESLLIMFGWNTATHVLMMG